jgi:hypothetical protein
MYVGEKRTLGKTYGIKERRYWEHHWGTHWEQRKYEKNLSPPNPKLQKNKNHDTLSAC